MQCVIDKAIMESDYDGARILINAELISNPDNHWLWAKLSETYYEQFDYKNGLVAAEQAVMLSPRCPLSLWEYGGALQMLERYDEAIHVFKSIVRRGIDNIAFGDCGEGLAFARGLVADCHYRLSRIYFQTGRIKLAKNSMRYHLSLRGPGCRSIYLIKDVRKEVAAMGMNL